jgi:hypothetical protein
MYLFFLLALMFAAIVAVCLIIGIVTGKVRGEALLGCFALTTATLTFFFAMIIRPSVGHWILPCPVLLGVASASFGWFGKTYPAMLRLCLQASILGIASCLCSIFFLSEPRSGDLQRQFFHTLGMSGFLVCTLITLKLLGPAAERSEQETEQRRQFFSRERRELFESRIRETDALNNSGDVVPLAEEVVGEPLGIPDDESGTPHPDDEHA